MPVGMYDVRLCISFAARSHSVRSVRKQKIHFQSKSSARDIFVFSLVRFVIRLQRLANKFAVVAAAICAILCVVSVVYVYDELFLIMRYVSFKFGDHNMLVGAHMCITE